MGIGARSLDPALALSSLVGSPRAPAHRRRGTGCCPEPHYLDQVPDSGDADGGGERTGDSDALVPRLVERRGRGHHVYKAQDQKQGRREQDGTVKPVPAATLLPRSPEGNQ